MYDYREFIEELIKRLTERYPEKEFLLRDVEKNNYSLKGLVVRNPGQEVCPTIYLENYYENYRENGMEDTLARFEDQMKAIDKSSVEINLSALKDPEKCKEILTCRLVRGDNNERFLSDRPHKETPFGELVLYLNLGYDGDQYQMIGVTDALYDNFFQGTFENVQEAFALAMENTERDFPPKIQSMTKVLTDIMARQFGMSPEESPDLMESLERGGNDMYVVSNESGVGGAVVLAYPENLQRISQEVFGGRDIVILPSSVHEAIIVEPRPDMGPRELLDMVKDVNRSQVPPDEVLADDAFYYKSKTREVLRATEMVKALDRKKEKDKTDIER